MTRSRLLPVLVACVFLTFGAVPGQAQSSSDSLSTPDATVYVDGLACPFCAYGLEKKLKSLDAIRAMEVQIEKGRILLAFKTEQSLTEKQIRKAVEEAGFTARRIEFAEESTSASPSSGP